MPISSRSAVVRDLRLWLLRLWRAGILIGIVLLIHSQARWLAAHHRTTISLAKAKKFFPAAYRVRLRDPARGLHYVSDSRDNTLGVLLMTSPETDDIIGYSGPDNLLIALGTDGVVAGVELLGSGDTKKHVQMVMRDPEFLRSFIGWKPGEKPPLIAAVSGATLTSYAIAESLQKRLVGAAASLRFPEPVTLEEAKELFTNAVSMASEGRRWRVLDSNRGTLGFLGRTSPEADNISGYRGPTEALVALAPDAQTITGVRLRKSYDTESYVNQVRSDQEFSRMFVGQKIDSLASHDYRRERIEGLSGATLTARAVAQGIQKRFAGDTDAPPSRPKWRPEARDWGAAAIVAGACLMAFTRFRGRRWARIAWQTVLIGYVGFTSGDLLSLSLLGGWASNGPALKAAPGLVLIAGAAFLLPLLTRRQVYCHQICPHGAAQQWLGAVGRRFGRRVAVVKSGAGIVRYLDHLPIVLLAFALAALVLGWPISLVNLEAFDAWSWRAAGWISVTIAAVGLIASMFIPQAYCRYGCPTGALLNFVRSPGLADRWSARDWMAMAVAGATALTVWGTRVVPQQLEPEQPSTTLRGQAMGSSWTVKIRDEIADPAGVQRTIAERFEWAEQMTSHWRSNTDLSLFNRTQSTEPVSVPWPVVTLARWSAEISRLTDGAFDITVGPVVKLWGFGPAPRRDSPPSDAELKAIRPAVGWPKLEILDGQLRKRHPALEIDLSAIAAGWAIDQVAEKLLRGGHTNFLIEAGGELRASGVWTIGIEHPSRACTLTNESIGTSGTYRQNFKYQGREYSHLIDPRTARPITHDTVSVSVRASDCAHADAWGAALNVMGAANGFPLAERLGLSTQFVVRKPNGDLEVRTTQWWDKPKRIPTPGKIP
ncbi:MAG TPA: FAD:protein FMN transferase [Verrucomicrobiae bacterium]|nr:FAD:protein FMN transferase [Verrucomicrobiae bacterium]